MDQPTGVPADYPAPNTPCTDETGYCAGTCYEEDDRYVYETSTDYGDVQAFCLCEHHDQLNIDIRRYAGIR